MINYPDVYDYGTLTEAVKIASNVSGIDTGIFIQNIDENIIQLQNELIWNTYKISPHEKDGERLVFNFRDIVIQIALCIAIDKSLIPLVGKKELFVETLNYPLDIKVLGLVNLYLTAYL